MFENELLSSILWCTKIQIFQRDIVNDNVQWSFLLSERSIKRNCKKFSILSNVRINSFNRTTQKYPWRGNAPFRKLYEKNLTLETFVAKPRVKPIDYITFILYKLCCSRCRTHVATCGEAPSCIHTMSLTTFRCCNTKIT